MRVIHKYKINGHDQTNCCSQMIPSQTFSLEKDHCKDGKNDKGDDFLNDFQLDKCERSAISLKAEPVARYLE